MNLIGEDPGAPKKPPFPVNIPIILGIQVGLVTLLVVFLSLFGGLALDKVFDTKPLFTFLLLLGSAPVALLLTLLIAKRAVTKLQLKLPSSTGSTTRAKYYDKEDDSE
jgi:hypothetical protein